MVSTEAETPAASSRPRPLSGDDVAADTDADAGDAVSEADEEAGEAVSEADEDADDADSEAAVERGIFPDAGRFEMLA